MQTFVSKIADTWSEAELTGRSGDTATVCLLAEYLTPALAATVKRYLAEDSHRISLNDFVGESVREAVRGFDSQNFALAIYGLATPGRH